jgi:hypothetical protein
MRAACAWAIVCLAATANGAECRLLGRPWLEGRVGAGASARSVDALRGEAIAVFLVARALVDGKRVLLSDEPRRDHLAWSRCGEVEVTWRRVEPRMQHTNTPAPNADVAVYANAVVFGPSHGEWIGFDKIEYFETPLDGGGTARTVRDARPSDATLAGARIAAHRELGVMRLAATVRLGGARASTPDAGDAPDGQISERVFRYTFRAGDDFLGWLTSFYNVPYLFGSAGKGKKSQAERYIGADCADILVAALRRAGRRDLEYSSVADLVDELHQVPRAQARPGDLLALDYVGAAELPREWDHIVVLVEDRGPDGRPDGVLGPDDLVADSGSADGLKVAPLAEQGNVRIAVLRARVPRS